MKPERPLQPFLVELLDQERGNWIFQVANGQGMKLEGKVRLTGTSPGVPIEEIGILLDNPEFPGEDTHAKTVTFPLKANKALLYTGNFKALISVKETSSDVLAELSEIQLGSAINAHGLPVMLTLRGGGRETALKLEGKNPNLKLATDRVGGVFTAPEKPVLYVERPENAESVSATLTVKDYYRNQELSKSTIQLNGGRTRIELPIDRFGSFVATVGSGWTRASERITCIPEPRMVDPAQSFVGMNMFQHSIPYLSYQLPLFAKAGVRHLRPWLHWENTWAAQEPGKGEWNTEPLDMLLRRMALYNQKYEYVIYKFSIVSGLKPGWPQEAFALNDEQMGVYKEYLRKIVTHCKGKVDEWEVWNEPDLLHNRTRDGFSGEFYVKFLIETAKTIREIDPAAKIHALSHAMLLDWFREVGKYDIRPYVDVITLHTYVAPKNFIAANKPRQQLVYNMGLWDVPHYYNEIGNAGFDLSETYRKAWPKNTEYNQAITVPLNYLQSLHVGGANARAYWFCSLGPRDGFHTPGWDTDNGLLYVGGLPKIGFASLAALSYLCDGYQYLGRVDFENGIRYMALSEKRAIVWNEAATKKVRAVELGALPGEELTVYDLFGNQIASGTAGNITLDFTDGPCYLLGSQVMGDRAAEVYRKERALLEKSFELEGKIGLFPSQVAELKPGESETLSCPVKDGVEISIQTTEEFPAEYRHVVKDGKLEITLTGKSTGAGMLMVSATITGSDASANRTIPVCVNERAFLFDGSFELGAAPEFPVGPVSFCATEGNRKPGCLRLDLSEGMRNNYLPKLRVRKGKDIHVKIALKGHLSAQASGHFKLAFFNGPFGSSPWLGDAHPADINPARKVQVKFGGQGISPEDIKSDRWQTFDVTIPGEQFTEDNMAVVLAVNFMNTGIGDYLLVDDFEITQEE